MFGEGIDQHRGVVQMREDSEGEDGVEELHFRMSVFEVNQWEDAAADEQGQFVDELTPSGRHLWHNQPAGDVREQGGQEKHQFPWCVDDDVVGGVVHPQCDSGKEECGGDERQHRFVYGRLFPATLSVRLHDVVNQSGHRHQKREGIHAVHEGITGVDTEPRLAPVVDTKHCCEDVHDGDSDLTEVVCPW